jgi:hypothetical protein
MSATRNRFDGTNAELQSALSPFVTHSAWLQYPDKTNDKVRPDILIAHKGMLRCLTQLSRNLSFSKKQLESVFQGLREEKQFQEISDPDFGEDWVQTMCKRLHQACRHTAQARLRRPPPKWVRLLEMGGHGGSVCDDESQSRVDEETPGAEAREAHVEDDAQLLETSESPQDAITVHACCICWQLQ